MNPILAEVLTCKLESPANTIFAFNRSRVVVTFSLKKNNSTTLGSAHHALEYWPTADSRRWLSMGWRMYRPRAARS